MLKYLGEAAIHGEKIIGNVDVYDKDVAVASCGFSTDGKLLELGSLEGGLLIVYDDSKQNQGIGLFAAKMAREFAIKFAREHERHIPGLKVVTGIDNIPVIKMVENAGYMLSKESGEGRAVYRQNLPAHLTVDTASKYGIRPIDWSLFGPLREMD